MKSIQQLHHEADHERQKAADLRTEAERYRRRAQDTATDPSAAQSEITIAQQNEDKALLREQEANEFDRQALLLEVKLQDIVRRKNEIQTNSQAEIDRLEQEERALRGDARGFF